MKKIAILGSTGSIGTQTLEVLAANPGDFKVTALCAGTRIEELAAQIREFRPALAVTADERGALALRGRFPGTEVLWGPEGLEAAATGDCDLVVNGLMGIKGLLPTYKAILAGKDIAFANKETLVAGGAPIMEAVRAKSVRMLPVDSEHSAIFQCLNGSEGIPVRRLILTASGGPFRGWSRAQLEQATLSQALQHPRWKMGPKITIDSATMMNKGLEVIEASWLFDVPPDRVDILVHPQSIVHSMVEFEDSSVLAQMGLPDMKLPIAYALYYPGRKANKLAPLDLCGMSLTFEAPDFENFPAIRLAYEAAAKGGTYPAVLNAANEALVEGFLREKLPFARIAPVIEETLSAWTDDLPPTIEGILEADRRTRIRLEETYAL